MLFSSKSFVISIKYQETPVNKKPAMCQAHFKIAICFILLWPCEAGTFVISRYRHYSLQGGLASLQKPTAAHISGEAPEAAGQLSLLSQASRWSSCISPWRPISSSTEAGCSFPSVCKTRGLQPEELVTPFPLPNVSGTSDPKKTS